jgi:hypothetical protein
MLDELGASKSMDKNKLPEASRRVQELEKEVNKAIIFLPPYDQRAYLMVGGLLPYLGCSLRIDDLA